MAGADKSSHFVEFLGCGIRFWVFGFCGLFGNRV